MANNPFVIAVDGPAASGKGTIGRKLAAHYGFRYLDTGSLYRAVATIMLQKGYSLNDEQSAEEVARKLDLSKIGQLEIRTEDAGRAAAAIAPMKSVREALLQVQRSFVNQMPGAVLDGRDIGTVVCPEADVKIFVTASAEIRANRRFLELKTSGSALSEAQVLEDTQERDRRDAERKLSPMRPADDAHLLDTSNLSIEAAFGQAVRIIDKSMR